MRRLDITAGPILPTLTAMAVPAAVGFLFNTLFNVVDTFWGGRISTDALAALSLSFPVFLVILATGTGIASGASALIANALGAGNTERAVGLQAQALSLAVPVALALTAPAIPLLKPIFRFMGAHESLLDSAFRYSSILVGGGIFFVLNAVLNAGLSARGDTRTYRNFLILGFVINVGLDPLFLFGWRFGGVTIVPAMQEAGIAVATIVIQAVGAVFLGWRLVAAGGLGGAGKRARFRPVLAYWREIGAQGVPAGLNMAAVALGAFVITSFVARYGTNAVAAYGSALRVEQIALIPTIGLNIALATMVGQNNGAGRIDRVQRSFRVSLLMGLAVMATILLPVVLVARPLLRVFTADAAVVEIGVRYLRIQVVTFYSYVVLNQSNSVLQGLKRPAMIMWVGLYRQIAAPMLVFPLLSSVFGWGVDGVWWGLAVVNWSAAAVMYLHAQRLLADAHAHNALQ